MYSVETKLLHFSVSVKQYDGKTRKYFNYSPIFPYTLIFVYACPFS